MIALIGTPAGDSQSESMIGHCRAGAVNRAFGWAAGLPVARPISGVHRSPRQSRHSAGGSRVIPSQHPPPSGGRGPLVKIVFRAIIAMAFGLVLFDVPGATPKTPASGLIACNCPEESGLIQAISSPTIETFQSLMLSGGINMARFVLPQALGKAAET